MGILKASKLLKAWGLISNNKELVKNASEFQEVHQEKWNEMISATALRNIREAKRNVPTVMPFNFNFVSDILNTEYITNQPRNNE